MLLNLLPEATPPNTPTRGPGLWLGGVGVGNDLNRAADTVLTWAEYVALCDAIRDLLPEGLVATFDSVVSNERTIYHDALAEQQTNSSEVVTETTALLTDMGS